ncbi:MAG: hypothetical protein RIS43_860 [Actinomycetota bacterium]
MFFRADTSKIAPPIHVHEGRGFVKRIISTTAVTLALMFGGAAAASAVTAPCASSSYCFYENANFNGWNGSSYTDSGWILQYASTYTADNFGSPAGYSGNLVDQMTSAINNTSKRLCIYNNSTLLYSLAANSSVSYNATMNDKADFWYLLSVTTCANTMTSP